VGDGGTLAGGGGWESASASRQSGQLGGPAADLDQHLFDLVISGMAALQFELMGDLQSCRGD